MIGYVPDTAPLADLARLIMDIHAGEQPCSGRVAAELLHRIALPRASASPQRAILGTRAHQAEREAAEVTSPKTPIGASSTNSNAS